MTGKKKAPEVWNIVVARKVTVSDNPRNPNYKGIEIQTFGDIYTGCMHKDKIPKKGSFVPLTKEASPSDHDLIGSNGEFYKIVYDKIS